MCIVIDSCCLSKVFKTQDEDYLPVFQWITTGKGKMVIGGSKYLKELSKVSSILQVTAQLKKIGKIHYVDNESVDELECTVKLKTSKKCDDPHIIALLGISRCPLVCSDDSRADEFLCNSELYPWKSFKPKIYRNAKKHKKLLSDEHASARIFTNKDENPKIKSFLVSTVPSRSNKE